MIRIVNTRTKRTVTARSGKDAVLLAKVELDRRSGIECERLLGASPKDARSPMSAQALPQGGAS